MNHSDYIESSQLQPVPGPEIRPDRQEPGPVPRDLIPREWLENKRLPDVLAHGIVVMAAGPTGLCFLTALHYWMPRSKNIYDGKIWVYNTLEKWCGYTGLPIGTLRRTIDALVNAGIVETWRPNRRQPVRYTLNYPKLRELAKAELIKAGYWPNSECDQIDHTQTAESDQINHTQSDQIDHTQTAESDQINHTQTAESDQNGQTIQETNYSQENKNSQETTTRNQAGGGEFDFEFLESEPRGVVQDCSLKAETPAPEPEPDRNRKQLESLVAQPDQAMADLSSQKHPAGDKSSAADFSAAEEILERAEDELGERIGPKAVAELRQKSPQALQAALEEAKRRRDNGEIKKSATGAFVELSRRDYQPPEEDQTKVVGKAIGSLLKALNLTGLLPPKWREETNCLTVSQLSLDQQRKYLVYLQDLEKQRQIEQAQAQADNEEESLGYILFGTHAAQAMTQPVATQRVRV